VNKELAEQYEVQGFPTIKILRNGGKVVQEYKGPREADGIVHYVKKQLGPASVEIKSADDAASVIDEKKIFIVSVFCLRLIQLSFVIFCQINDDCVLLRPGNGRSVVGLSSNWVNFGFEQNGLMGHSA